LRITVEVTFTPDVSPMAFVTCRAREGAAGRPLQRHTRVLATGALEELEEVVSQFLHLAIARAAAREPLTLWDEN
jgi:hypothetical protein